MDYLPLLMFLVLLLMLMWGYPVSLTLGAVALMFASIGILFDLMRPDFFQLATYRIYGIVQNFTLLAVPLFVFMGVVFEKSGMADELLETMAMVFARVRGGLAISIIVVGGLLAATTGIVGATVVTMAVIALPTMLKHGYKAELATGTIAASGTLGQLLPPSVILVLLASVMNISPGDVFAATIIPGAILIGAFILYIYFNARFNPAVAPMFDASTMCKDLERTLLTRVLRSLLPPMLLIVAVLGSIFFGLATPTEAAAFGALGAMIIAALNRRLTRDNVRHAVRNTTRLTSMVFLILIGATAFGLVFNGLHGDQLMKDMITAIPGGVWGFILFSMLLIFILGFFLDFLEISFIVVPILAVIAQANGVDLIWFAVLIAVNLQTSFLTPPFGFSLFYLKAAAPPQIRISHIYRGVVPFIILQILVLTILIIWPGLATWLPEQMSQWQR